MKNNLEDKIIKKVYEYETRQTVVDIVLRIAAIIATLMLGGLLVELIYQRLAETETLDVLQIFHEDYSVIHDYLGEVMDTVYTEFPKIYLAIFIITAICFLILVLYFFKNFGKIKRKFTSIIHYWKK